MSAPVDEILVAGSFKVDIDGGDESDGSWKGVTGGAHAIEIEGRDGGGDGRQRPKPGRAFVTPVILRGPITDRKRAALLVWLNETATGKDARRRVTITVFDKNGKPIRTDIYDDCYIQVYRAPRLSAGSAEPIEEVVVLKATRYTTA
jgi:phage tail-like protein